ncbi:cob(I)yrinic acid a,c-diamide adenosyltransferase [Chloroflexota bacterium]
MPGAQNKGLVLVYTGNGKGKTSAAMGAALRALGHGKRVHIVYFMKGSSPYGEQVAMSSLPNITFSRFGLQKFVDPDNVTPEDKEEALKSFSAAYQATVSGKYDLVILDEVNIAAAWKLVEIDEVIELIDSKPANVDLILTGRYADQKLVEKADLVTEMKEIKHPYASGIKAKKGIDY